MFKKTAIITGSAGMLSSELIKKLINKKINIVGIDNFRLGHRKNIKKFLKFKNFHFFKIDLNREIKNKKLHNFLKNKEITDIWHFAANSDIKKGINNPDIDYEDTFLTTYYVLKYFSKFLNQSSNFIFTSSSAIYGEVKGKITDESFPQKPQSNYGSMKLASESIVSSFSYLNGFKSFIFRLPNVVGKNLTHGVVYDLSNKIKNKKINFLQVLGDGNQCKPYSHASEIINCMSFIKSMRHLNLVNHYNIGNSDKGVKVKYIVKLLKKKFSFKKKIVYQKSKVGWKGDIPKYQYYSKKLKKTGFRFFLNSKQAINKTIDEL